MLRLLSHLCRVQFIVAVAREPRLSKLMSSATDGVMPDVRELSASGLGDRKRSSVVALFGVIGVAGRRVALSRWAANRGEEMSSGRVVRLFAGVNEGGCTVEARDRDDAAPK